MFSEKPTSSLVNVALGLGAYHTTKLRSPREKLNLLLYKAEKLLQINDKGKINKICPA